MLSYRHGYHAGNHADVLKHMLLCLTLRFLNHKDKPYSIIDTHAGAGFYSLNSVFAQKNKEYLTGLQKVIANEKLHKLVPEYFEVIKSINNKAAAAEFYPGSPLFECALSREEDRLTFIDLHPAEIEVLKKNFSRDSRVNIQRRNGFEALNALLPPNPRRGLCVIDPSYEEKTDYIELVKYLKTAIKKWNVGSFFIWYPVLARTIDHSKKLVQDIKRLNLPLLQAELQIEAQAEDIGMCGSGILLVNYPFGIETKIEEIMNELYQNLGNEGAKAKVKILNEKE